VETLQSIVELNHGKDDNIGSENMKLLNLFFLSRVYQLVRRYFKKMVSAKNKGVGMLKMKIICANPAIIS
jgi:hypothetical protein